MVTARRTACKNLFWRLDSSRPSYLIWIFGEKPLSLERNYCLRAPSFKVFKDGESKGIALKLTAQPLQRWQTTQACLLLHASPRSTVRNQMSEVRSEMMWKTEKETWVVRCTNVTYVGEKPSSTINSWAQIDRLSIDSKPPTIILWRQPSIF